MSACASIYRGTARNVSRLARALARGELVGVPTETVYGLAGDALNEKAVRAIFRAKGRPSNDPLIVHIHSLAQLDQLAERNTAVDRLAHAFWPGPLTIVLPKKPLVPALVTSGQDSVAIRMPAHPLFQSLLRKSNRPLAAPSANPFGYLSPTTAQHVRDHLGKKIRYVLDGGECEIGLESTILDLRNPRKPAILRPGAIERKAIERVLGRRVTHTKRAAPGKSAHVIAPGMLTKHYSPHTPVVLHRHLSLATQATVSSKEAMVFVVKPRAKGSLPANCFWLAETRDLTAAAHALFARLRELDRAGWKKIHLERASGSSALALAINDRLQRAAARR